MTKNLSILLLVLMLFSCHEQSQESIEEPEIPLVRPVVLAQEGADLEQYWDFTSGSPVKFSNKNGAQEFRDSMSLRFGDRLKELLDSQLLINAKVSPKTLAAWGPLEAENWELLHQQGKSMLTEISSVENEIFNYQASRYPMLSQSTEFQALVSYHETSQMYRVYFGAGDKGYPPKCRTMFSKIEDDIQDGWVVKYHLHNHFNPDSLGKLGVLAPSMTDVQFYKALMESIGLPQSRVTNGFHTIRIDSSMFSLLNSH